MKKTLKSIKSKFGMLNEAYAWERQEGKPLPTLADVQAKYNAKSVNEQEQAPESAIRSYHIQGFTNTIDALEWKWKKEELNTDQWLESVDAAVARLKNANPGKF